jgi:hypothetical protein
MIINLYKMSVPTYYSKIVANTFNDNFMTVKTLRSKFNETTSPILQSDERYRTEPKLRPFSGRHLMESKIVDNNVKINNNRSQLRK